MKAPATLVVFHYHLLRGGVRSALERSLKCLARAGWTSGRTVRVVVGRREGVKSFRRSLEDWIHGLEVFWDPALDYRDDPWPDDAAFERDFQALGRRFLEYGGGETLFWVHNPVLGKNAAVSAAWKFAAEEAWRRDLPFRFLYHIHDFVECGRLPNLIRLRRCWRKGGVTGLYPGSPNTGYGVLNRTDERRLRDAGIPRERVFFLPNLLEPLPSAPDLTRERERFAKALGAFAQAEGFPFDPHRPWWLLPIRLIRRKNVLEAFWLALHQDPVPQVLITLDANSRQERPYAEAVKNLVKKKRLPAVVGFGLELVGKAFSMGELMGACDLIVTSSLLEGFGFSFLEGPLMGRPLWGRNLPEVTSDFESAGFPADRLYESVPVPVPQKTRNRLADGGKKFIGKFHEIVPELSPSSMERFAARVDEIFRAETVDFGMLDLEGQAEVLSEAASSHPSAGAVESPPLRPVLLEERSVQALFEFLGPEAHAKRLIQAFDRLFEAASERRERDDFDAVGRRLVDLFFDPRYHRPLFGGWK